MVHLALRVIIIIGHGVVLQFLLCKTWIFGAWAIVFHQDIIVLVHLHIHWLFCIQVGMTHFLTELAKWLRKMLNFLSWPLAGWCWGNKWGVMGNWIMIVLIITQRRGSSWCTHLWCMATWLSTSTWVWLLNLHLYSKSKCYYKYHLNCSTDTIATALPVMLSWLQNEEQLHFSNAPRTSYAAMLCCCLHLASCTSAPWCMVPSHWCAA